MWRLKQFMPKEPTGLEGRTVEIGNLKVHVRNAIAEGGFSCVYLARAAVNSSKQYALKHMICNDEESLDLVKKEISVMKLLNGHPNVVALRAHSIFDIGRTKEALLVMEFCEKSLVSVLESRGAGYFEEQQILLIFRDICNAVFAMHCLSPPIAHRDLKAENVLLGPDGELKLCDFGSTSTNHKCFDRPEEMGIEEDNIRKHTTPAYRAPEMWDLFRKETISEKVDIWALGCLLYRICYLKSAFDGESKLQILNGNYCIPDLPRYSSSVIELIKDMLQASPDVRPDITQVWFRVNELLPLELQKQTPDGPILTVAAGMHLPATDAHNGEDSKQTVLWDFACPMHTKRAPRRTPPPPPSSREQAQNASPSSQRTTKAIGGGAPPLGAFWSTQYAKDPLVSEDNGPLFFYEGPGGETTFKTSQQHPENHRHMDSTSPPKGQNVHVGHQNKTSLHGSSQKRYDASSEDFEIRFFSEDKDHDSEKNKTSKVENVGIYKNEAFNAFVAEFDSTKLNSGNNRTGKEALEAEVERLKEQLKQASLEKGEITSKYEKLSAICHSQRQEIQELKQALTARTPSPNTDGSRVQQSSPSGREHNTQKREITKGSVWELQEGRAANSSLGPDSKAWKAFTDKPEVQPLSANNQPRSVRRMNGHQNKKAPVNSSADDTWGFGQDTFTAISPSSRVSVSSDKRSNSQQFSNKSPVENKQKSTQPAGWAGF